MRVVQAQIQTVEEIYRLVWTAVSNKQPIEAKLPGPASIVWAAPTGPQSGRATSRTVLPIRRRKPERTPTGGLACKLALCGAGETQQGEVSGRRLAHSAKSFAPCFLRGRSRYRRGGSARARSTKRTLRKLPKQLSGKHNSQGGNRIWIMPFGANAVIPAGGSLAPAWGQGVQDGWRGRRGKNGSARPPGTHKPRCTAWRDGGIRASCDLQSAPTPTLVSAPHNPVR